MMGWTLVLMDQSPDDTDRRLTIAETCRWLGCDEKSVRRRIKKNQLQAEFVGRRWWISRGQVAEERAKLLEKFGIYDPPPPGARGGPAAASSAQPTPETDTVNPETTPADDIPSDGGGLANPSDEVERLRHQITTLRNAARVLLLGVIDS